MARLLGEYGADVIKIESNAAPDFIRGVIPGPMNPPFASSNRNKRFPPDPSLPRIEVKDYEVGKNAAKDFSIPDNRGCCSTAKG